MDLLILDFMRKWALNILGSLLLLLTLIGCQKKDGYAEVLVIGHGGNGLDNLNSFYHDNSLESILMALDTEGCSGVELDVQMSIDGTLWLFHDETLANETGGEGCIPDQTDAYLGTLHYSTLNAEDLIRLDDVPSSHLMGKIVYIDTRSLNNCSGSEIDVMHYLGNVNDFQAANLTAEIVICTGSLTWLEVFQTAGYKVMPQITAMEMYQDFLISFPMFVGVVVANSDIKKEEVSLIQGEGKEVVIFDVRSSTGIRSAFKKMPDAIMTDNIRKTLIEKY
jgi:glycerophosphoryl diester phosphodiesterase